MRKISIIFLNLVLITIVFLAHLSVLNSIKLNVNLGSNQQFVMDFSFAGIEFTNNRKDWTVGYDEAWLLDISLIAFAASISANLVILLKERRN